MLKGISPLISPELLNVLYRMGQGDELVLADAHFPAERLNRRVIWANGMQIGALLEAILPLVPLDDYVDAPVTMMRPAEEEETVDPAIEASYRRMIEQHWPDAPKIAKVDRYTFYKQTESAFAVVVTGDVAKYSNIIITKGIVPIEA